MLGGNQMIEDQDITCVVIEKIKRMSERIIENFPEEVDSKKKFMSNCLSHLTKGLKITKEDLENSEFNNIKIDDRKKIVEAYKSNLNSPKDLLMIMCVLANNKIKNMKEMEKMEMEKMEMEKMEMKNKGNNGNVFDRLYTGNKIQQGGNDEEHDENIMILAARVASTLLLNIITLPFILYLIVYAYVSTDQNQYGGGEFDCSKIIKIYNELDDNTKELIKKSNKQVLDGLTDIDNNFDEKFNKLKNVEEKPLVKPVEESVEKSKSPFDTGDKLLNYTFGGRRSRSKRNKRVKGGFTKKKGGKKKSNKKRVRNVTKGGRRKLSKTRRNVRSKK